MFLKSAPRNLIVVARVCIQPRDDCNRKFHKAIMFFATKYNFTIVRNISTKRESYSFEEFKKLIYGTFLPSKTVVIFKHWGGGIASKIDPNRYTITEIDECWINNSFRLENSAKIINDSKRYVVKYLPEDKGYISVMLRTERIGLDHVRKSPEIAHEVFDECLTEIAEVVQNLAYANDLHEVFIAVDNTKYSSRYLRNNSAPEFMSNMFLGSVNDKLKR